MFREIEIVELFAENSKIGFIHENNSYHYFSNDESYNQFDELANPINLYFLFNDEPEIGDWCYCEDGIFQYMGKVNITDTYLPKKVIATTHKFLNDSGVASIPDSFLKEYCKFGGIDKIFVNFTYKIDNTLPHFLQARKYFPKTNKNNEVIIEVTPP